MSKLKILLLGATGSIGHSVHKELQDTGHQVTCLARSPVVGENTFRVVDFSAPVSIENEGIGEDHFDAVVSCMASRTGTPKDAWAVDYQAHANVLKAAKSAGIGQFILLSAICVQKPLLAFQKAKLAFEEELIKSGLAYSIVRPTAFFKSLSGQLDRLRQGKKFLLFGDGELTSCKPISDRDLARFMADCLVDPAKQNQILPIGGPGPAITPLEQGAMLFDLLGEEPHYSRVPVSMMSVIIGILGALGLVIPPLKEKAELAKIGRYYATESM
ncbi:MAG: NAD(P)H-binding protein, partial [Pseudomonadota bacterium]